MTSCAHPLYHAACRVFQHPALRLSFQALMLLFLYGQGRPLPAHSRLKSGSALSRFLNRYAWNTRALIRVYRQHVHSTLEQLLSCRRGRKPALELIVDLTSLDKAGKFEGLTGWLHGLNKHYGVHLVLLYICVGDFRFPWSFRIWKGKGSKSVTLLALDLIRTVPASLTQGREVWVYADGGFDAALFIRSVHACGFVCVVGTRKNRQTTERKPLSSYPFRTRTIQLPAVSHQGESLPITFSWVWLKRDNAWEKRYILCTRALSPQNLARIGKRRWKIEGFFKTAKHRFNLHRFAQGTKIGVLRFLLLSLLAYLLAHLRGLHLGRARAHTDWPDWGELAEDVALELMAHLIFMLHDLERDRLHQRRIALQL